MTRVDGFPFELEAQGDAPLGLEADDGVLRIEAGALTDVFASADGSEPRLGSPRLVARVGGDFLLSALVGATFASKYDAGGLLVWLDERNWAKLALEQSPEGEPTIVSVVTRGVSDDCNSWAATSPARLRVARIGPAYAFHVSTDGSTWSLVRHFALAAAGDPLVGFVAQAPTGERCTATFESIAFSPERLADLRSGV